MSKIFKLFLASSGELKKERKDIEDLIKRYNHVCIKFEVQMWENMSRSFKARGIQKDTIDKVLKNSDVVILIFHSRVGKFTKKELDIAMKGIKNNTGKPKYLLFYFTDKTSPKYQLDFNDISTLENNTELMKLIQKFKKKQTPIKFKSRNDLKSSVNEELRKIEQLEYEEILINTNNNQNIITTTKENYNIKIRTNLAPKDKNFIDREEDIKEIIRAIISSKECLVYSINGMGGIGKSAIINEICHIFKATWEGKIYKEYLKNILGEKSYFSDGILWIKFEEDISLEKHIEILSTLIDYKIDYTKDKNKLKSILKQLFENKDVLVVLDSCEQNIKNFKFFHDIFIDFIPMLITSRKSFNFISYKKDLDILDKDSARELFKQTISLNHDEMDIYIDNICKDIGYLPLAIIITSKITDKYGLDITLKKLKDKLSQDGEIIKDGEEKNININNIFNLSFNLLDQKEKKILALASIFNYPFKLEVLNAIIEDDVVEILYELENKSLVNKAMNEKGENIYSFHPLIREFSQEKFKEILSSEEKNKYKKAKEKYFLNIAHKEKGKLKEHIKEIFDILKSCGDKEFISFVKALDWWLVEYGYWVDRERLLKEAINKNKDENTKNILQVSLGDLYQRQNKLFKAKKELREALNYFNIHNNFRNYLFINYSLNTIQYSENDDKISYTNNLKFMRESLYLDQIFNYTSFFRTNGWITKNYLKKDLAIESFIGSFLYKLNDIRSTNTLYALEDIIKYLIIIEEYKKAKNLISKIKNYYTDDMDINSLLLDEININIETNKFSNNKILKECELSAKRIGNEFTLNYINFLRGKTYLYKKNPQKAKEYFNRLNKEHEKYFWLGRCEIELNNLLDAKKHLNNSITFYKRHENIFEFARVNLYLGFIESKINIKKANKIFSHSKAVFNTYHFIPKEYHILHKQIDNINIDISNIRVKSTSFFLDNLPEIIKLRDNKKMKLISKGSCFFGEGNLHKLTIDEIVNNIDSFFKEHRYKEYNDNMYLYDFYIDKECVSNKEYINYCKESGTPIPKHLQNISNDEQNNPLTNISINAAKKYAQFYNKEIPLPQEWEKAFRGKEGAQNFANSSNKNILVDYKSFELIDIKKYRFKNIKFKSTHFKHKLTDSFEEKDVSQFVFRCVKPVFTIEDIKDAHY